jgi:hypothetical protein
MKNRKIRLPEELKYTNRIKWGFDSANDQPKKITNGAHPSHVVVELYNFYDYSFSLN